MRYELVNRYYGTKLISPSEKHKDAFIAACKKDPVDNKPVWAVGRELPDNAGPTREGELLAELKRLQEELDKATGAEKGSTVNDESPQDVGGEAQEQSSSIPTSSTKKKSAKK